jgi:hypothetical protein
MLDGIKIIHDCLKLVDETTVVMVVIGWPIDLWKRLIEAIDWSDWLKRLPETIADAFVAPLHSVAMNFASSNWTTYPSPLAKSINLMTKAFLKAPSIALS